MTTTLREAASRSHLPPPAMAPVGGVAYGKGQDHQPRLVVLVVAGDSAVRSHLAAVLQRWRADPVDVVVVDPGEAAQRAQEIVASPALLAVVIADQRMTPTGVDLLRDLQDLAPEARRVLLHRRYIPEPSAWGDADAVPHALASGLAHGLVGVPWTDDDALGAEVTSQLSDWALEHRQLIGHLVVVSRPHDRRSHELRELLSRNRLPFAWVDVDSPEGTLLYRRCPDGRLPLVVLPDRQILADPSPRQVADALGVNTRPDDTVYDVAIVGAGPGGLAAAVYGASEGLRTILIEREATGGQAGTSSRIENYLGFPQGISGALLADRALWQARRLGGTLVIPREVVGLSTVGPEHHLALDGADVVRARTIVIASGVTYRRLDAPGVERLIGAGVYYGSALSEAPACQDKDVYLVGGGNSAGQAALHLARFARHVTLLVRGESLPASMSHYLTERIQNTAAIHVRTQTSVAEAHGDTALEALTVEDPAGRHHLPADALFVLIGGVPHTSWLPSSITRDRVGYLLAGNDLLTDQHWQKERPPLPTETSTPGVFAVGDVRSGSVKRVASAVGEGSVTISYAHTYLDRYQPATASTEPIRST